jgi:hypothetical protein
MTDPILVQIIGSTVACSEGNTDAWRQTADWAASQLKPKFGDAVQVVYFDLFDPACPPLPLGASLPVVMIDGAVLINGGKISIPLIRKQLVELGVDMKTRV